MKTLLHSTLGLFFAMWSAAAVAEPAKRPKADGDGPQPTRYVQTAIIEPQSEQGAVLGLCGALGGGLVAVTGATERYGVGPQRGGKAKPIPHRLVWFDAEGTEARALDLDFSATCVAAAPAGGFYIAGNGIVALVSVEGKEVIRCKTPQAAKTEEEIADLEKTATERRDMQVAAYEKQIERTRAAVEQLEEKVKKLQDADEAASEAEKADEDGVGWKLRKQLATSLSTAQMQANRMASQLRDMEKSARGMRRQDPRQLVEQALLKTRQVRAISASRDSVFIVVGEPSGYGYAAWRFDDRLENPEKVLAQLAGCCGQMDVQVIGERLAVAANRKHCVEVCSFDGTTIAKVGARVAPGDGGAGFGGCCNPMNICQAPDGSLLTSESDGVVKRFSVEGEFVEILGRANIRAGCKNSAIAIEPDGSRLYYMDSTSGKVLVLTKAEDQKTPGPNTTADREK